MSAQPAHVIVSDPLRFANDSSPIRSDGGTAGPLQLVPPPLQRQGSSSSVGASAPVSRSGSSSSFGGLLPRGEV